MRTHAILLALLALAALPGGSRAEDTAPADEEARLQELEQILQESEAESEPESEAESEPESEAESEPESEPEPEAKPEPGTASEAVADSGPPECARPVLFRRGGVPEPVVVRLVDCAGQPSSDALAALSALAQPPADGGELQQLNPGLLVRLQRIAERFPGHAIDVVSGLRPKARPGSRHRSGDALDIRIEGVGEAELAELARTLEGTGVGFYPNSTFVHIDVRVEPAYWVDRSHPGEPPDYGPWPPATDGAATPATETVEPPAAPDTVEAAAEPMMKTAEPPAGTGAAEVGATDTVEPPAATDTIEPPAATDAIEPPAATDTVEPAAEDPELQALADRALWVMNRELGGDERDDSGMLEPEPATELL